jgi:glycosyltransferase involved in cell wall biosynthesis
MSARTPAGADLLISVIVPVYNAEAYVEQAVHSALEQPFDLEVILVEDGSSDNSLAVCDRLAREDERVRLMRHPGGANKGAGASRNVGIRAARGKYIAFLDADDYMLPERFQTDIALLEADPTLDGVHGAVASVFEEGHAPMPGGDRGLTALSAPVEPGVLFGALAGGGAGQCHTAGVTVRRELFERTGLFDENLPLAQDSAMWLKMAAVGRLASGSIREPVAVRRRHAANRSTPANPLYGEAPCAYTFSVISWARRAGLPYSDMELLRQRMRIAIFSRLNGRTPCGRLREVVRRILKYAVADPGTGAHLFLYLQGRIRRLALMASHYLLGRPRTLPGAAVASERGDG